MPKRAAATARVRDRATTAAARLHTQQHRAVPIPIALIQNTRAKAQRLGRGLMIIHKLNLTAARTPLSHPGACRNSNNDLLIERTADRRAGELLDQLLRRAKHTTAWAAHILAVDKETCIALAQLHQRLVN